MSVKEKQEISIERRKFRARRVDVAALELVAVGEGDGVHDEVEAAPFTFQRAEDGLERLVVLDVGFDDDLRAHRLDERLHALAEGVALVGEGEFGAVLMQSLRNAPGDGVIIGDAHDQAALAGHQIGLECHGLDVRPLEDE
jgi:hypothetical protein